MQTDLWGFKDINELEKATADMPDSILKEQIDLLGDKTEFVLYGKPTCVLVHSERVDFKMATIFDIVVPKLDNYSKTILIMYSNPENDYPVTITYGSNYEDDCEHFTPKYTCTEKDTFVTAIKEILSSDYVMSVVKTLYSKASRL